MFAIFSKSTLRINNNHRTPQRWFRTSSSQCDTFEDAFHKTKDQILSDEKCLSIVIYGLSKHMSTGKFKSEISSIPGFTFYHFNRLRRSRKGFITFRNNQEKIKSYPLLQQLRIDGNDWSLSKFIQFLPKGGDDYIQDDLKNIVDRTSPWWKTPYEEQLRRKTQSLNNTLHDITQTTKNNLQSTDPIPDWITSAEDGRCCVNEGIIASPKINGYRTKCDFSVGYDRNNDPVVGFHIGHFFGSTVIDPINCVIVSDLMKSIRDEFQEYISQENSPLPYDIHLKQGFWREISVREFSSGLTTIIITINGREPTDLKASEKEKMIEFVKAKLPEHSVYWRESSSESNSHSNIPIEHISGTTVMIEELLGYRFRLSPLSFYQSNLEVTKLLYSHVGEWAELDEDTTLLDVCCGTGMIGIVLSKKVKNVIGFEIVSEAISDAEFNAKLNGVDDKVSYVLGSVEDTLENTLSSLSTKKIVAIVDPPRAGLHKTVLKALRNTSAIDRIVYISCEGKSLVRDASTLCSVNDSVLGGTPFKPVKSVAFDMFPHTDKLESVMLFERMNS